MNLTERRALLHRQFPVRPSVYWVDFLLSTLVGWGALFAAAWQPTVSASHGLLALLACAGLYRAAYFVHELSHHRRALPGLELAWNALVGLWLSMPSMMVDPHVDHHRLSTYGTARDPEYEPVGRWGLWQCAASVLLAAAAPALLWLRFAVVAPLSFAHPSVRRSVVAHLSTLATNLHYRRVLAEGDAARFLVQEAAACLAAWFWVALVIGHVLPTRLALEYAGVAGVTFAINQLRTNIAHLYEGNGAPFSLEGQLGDTTTVESRGLFAAVFPVGTRWHALHHLAPQLPYHALGLAHAQLMASAPAPYRRGRFLSLGAALAALLRRAAQNSSPRSAQAAAVPVSSGLLSRAGGEPSNRSAAQEGVDGAQW